MRLCKDCNQSLPLSAFPQYERSAKHQCRACYNAKRRRSYSRDPRAAREPVDLFLRRAA